jgi:hypothetical protein
MRSTVICAARACRSKKSGYDVFVQKRTITVSEFARAITTFRMFSAV